MGKLEACVSDSGSSSTRSSPAIADVDARELAPAAPRVTVRVVAAEEDDPDALARVRRVLADFFAGRLG